MQALRPARLSTHGRVMGATLLVLLAVFALAGQQALHIARHDADTALRVQATAQLAALSQAVAESAIRGDYPAVQARLRIPIDQGNLRQVEYTAPDGRVLRQQAHLAAADRPDWFARLTRLALPVMQEDLIIGGSYYGRLRIQPSSHAYEDFLWHLGTRLFLLLGLAIALLGWLTHALLRINLKDLTRLSVTARQIEAGNYSVRLPI
ncbi:MAG TPA: LapD/MoxY N-terminal periplasmic domain-containing protein, partial [Steroidobacteraceae bacterium]|nr:LapD/MoxY N-terminal periplasmic domain-containing protein [Steroidobacteraceae bacterium]